MEGSGNCHVLAVFASALMKAGGLDSIVLLGDAKQSQEESLGTPHAIAAVNLPQQPSYDNRQSISYYDYNGERYYLAEATWSSPFTDSSDTEIIGSLVGDNPW